MLMKKLTQEVVCPCPGAIYMYIFFETAWPINAKFHVEPPSEGGTVVYINGPGHMTKMAATPIFGTNI